MKIGKPSTPSFYLLSQKTKTRRKKTFYGTFLQHLTIYPFFFVFIALSFLCYTHTHTRIDTNTHARTHIYTRTQTHTHALAQIHTPAHTYELFLGRKFALFWWRLTPTHSHRGQFHQHFTRSFLCEKIPKSQKKTDNLTVFFVPLGSVCIKALHKMLVKMAPVAESDSRNKYLRTNSIKWSSFSYKCTLLFTDLNKLNLPTKRHSRCITDLDKIDFVKLAIGNIGLILGSNQGFASTMPQL